MGQDHNPGFVAIFEREFFSLGTGSGYRDRTETGTKVAFFFFFHSRTAEFRMLETRAGPLEGRQNIFLIHLTHSVT